MNRIVKNSRTGALCLSFCMALGVACTAQAQTWVGSTGAVDPTSLSSYQFDGTAVLIRPSLPDGQVVIRYNVSPGAFQNLTQACCESRVLVVRFVDNGAGAQVQVKLKRYNIFTGATTTLLSFDSNNSTPQSGFQTTPITGTGNFFNFSFADGPYTGGTNEGGDSVYYLVATLIRSAPGGNPQLASISIVTELAP
jgi:hypothetical protein